MPIILQDGNIVCGTEVSFLNRDEGTYPQLMRLHLDFDFRVLSLSNPVQENTSPAKPVQNYLMHHNAVIAKDPDARQASRYLVTFNTHQHQDVPTITPVFSSLPELESYAHDNIVDILNKLVVDAQGD